MTHLEIIGRVWSDWSITEKLGEGSFGQVFRARKERFGVTQEAAIKVVRIPGDDVELKRVQSGYGLNEQELKEYFYPEVEKLKKEIVLMQELGEDSHIVRILDFEIIDAPDSIVGWYILIRMELLECLENYIKRADITVADVVAIGEDVLTSLEVCEERNIIHRDIKPANLFRSDKGVYKLGDFGIARDMRAGMGSLSHKGTENYMAPEVYLGKNYTSNIDIYALGIVLYKLLNKNRLPFMNEEKLTAGSVERAFQKRNTGEELPKPVESPDTLYEIIKKMCAYNPNERFQTALEVKKALSEYRQNHKEELKRLLNVVRKPESTQNQFKQQSVNEVNIFREDEQVKNDSKVNDNKSNISSMQSDKKYSGTKDIKDIEPELSNSNNNENKTEGYKDGGTKSIYEASRQSQANVAAQPVKEQASKEKTVIERVEQVPKKKSKIGLILGIGAGVLVLLIGTFIFIGSNVKEEDYTVSETSRTSKKNNKETEAETREENSYKEETIVSEEESSAEKDTVKEGGEAIAREIADDDSIFEIDMDKYAEYSMEYTTTLVYKRVIQEISGIYLGNTEEGKPDGYGLFYYRMEYTYDSFGKYIDDFIYFGEWEAGSLKEGKTVKKRYRHYSERHKSNRCYILNGEWEKEDFKGNPEGKYVEEINNSNGEWEEVVQAEGVFEESTPLYFIVKGTEYRDSIFGGKLKFEGDFNKGMLYNGTVYDENGNVQWTVVDGENHY
mgnify:CR=1 FL=1